MSNPRLQWLKWYPRDFASSTRLWPLIARGAFRELIDAQWDIGGANTGTLPDDEEQLRLLVRATAPEWRVAWPYVEPKFPRVDGGRRNARLEQHRQLALREYAAFRKGARMTNAKRWGNGRSATQ